MRTKFACIAIFLLLAGCGTTRPPHIERLPGEITRIESLPADAHSELSMVALAQLGIPYANGGNTPEQGFDCSGLVNYVYRQATGLSLPRTTFALFKMGRVVEEEGLQPGDLVFYNTLSRAHSHVGIYLGEERFIHAPSSGGVVRIESMRGEYWVQRYNGARRLLPG